jgi:cephalosporin hydroxylase
MRKIIKQVSIRLLKLAERPIVNLFHILWYHSHDTWGVNQFLGFTVAQCPLDLQLYQEIIYRLKPLHIVQTGVANGGSLLFFATMLDLIGAPPQSLVIGVDIELTAKAKTLSHPRIRLFEGNSVDSKLIESIRQLVPDKSAMVILDSNHHQKHVEQELAAYCDFVGIDQFLVVEDTNINGHPVAPFFGPGPLEAVDVFLDKDRRFIRDDIWKRNKFSHHQNGWLVRKS